MGLFVSTGRYESPIELCADFENIRLRRGDSRALKVRPVTGYRDTHQKPQEHHHQHEFDEGDTESPHVQLVASRLASLALSPARERPRRRNKGSQ